MQASGPRSAQTAVTLPPVPEHHACHRVCPCDGVESAPRGRTQHGVQRARSLVVLSPVLVFELQEPRFSLRIDQDVSQSQAPIADRSLR
jgi:hypothetical protein